MNIKRFFGKNSREALSLVRKELGEDAVILSNRSMNGGNEIMAFKEEDMFAMIASQSKPQQTHEDSEPTTLLSLINKKNRTQTSNTSDKKSESISDDANKPADGNKQAKRLSMIMLNPNQPLSNCHQTKKRNHKYQVSKWQSYSTRCARCAM